METVSECPVCGGTTFVPYLSGQDYLVSGETFTIVECGHCQLRFTNPRPDQATIGSYYQSDQYVSHNDAGGGLLNTAYRMVRSYTLQAKLKTVTSLNGGVGNLLDVGCGTGAFLHVCQQHGWRVTGMEPDDAARAVASQKTQTNISSSLGDLQQTHPFNVITLWHVLEHVADLNQTAFTLYNLLANDGTLLVAVPNCASYDAGYYQQFWAAYDLPRHLYHFTPETINRFFAKHGFRLAEQRPMRFDAFYISLLSSRYQSGSTNYLSSVQVGLMSNSRAARTGNFSSLTYIYKKQ